MESEVERLRAEVDALKGRLRMTEAFCLGLALMMRMTPHEKVNLVIDHLLATTNEIATNEPALFEGAKDAGFHYQRILDEPD